LSDPTSLTSLPEESNIEEAEAMKVEPGPTKSLFFGVPKKTECPFKHDYYYTDKIRHKKYCLCDCPWCAKTNKETELPAKVYVP